MEIKLKKKYLPLPGNQKKISLANNEIWKEPVTFTPSSEGKNMKLEFLLFNETDRIVPYRDLHLWIDVNTKKATEALDIKKSK
jgi:uncharacterized membrane protein